LESIRGGVINGRYKHCGEVMIIATCSCDHQQLRIIAGRSIKHRFTAGIHRNYIDGTIIIIIIIIIIILLVMQRMKIITITIIIIRR
jgi:hypothetical protein